MMRTALILLITFLVLGGAFTLYITTQSKTQVTEQTEVHPAVPDLPIDSQEPAPYHGGAAGKLKQYDNRTGRISSEMLWNSFTRHKDGTTTVVEPSMSFAVGDGQKLSIVGDTGLIDNFNAPAMTSATGGKQPLGMPDRGTLQHVHVFLYPNWDKTAQPNLILTTENLAFDNATFRIATAAYTDENGNSIAADQVPVHVTGDYLFDGRGLTVQWNDRDNRLELLEVAHGEQLTIVHPGNVFGSSIGPKPVQGSAGAFAAPVVPPTFSSMLASTDRLATAMLLPGTRPLKAARPPQPPYLARFFQNVVISQGLETNINADSMDVGFVLKSSSPNPMTRPATRPSNEPQPAPAAQVAPTVSAADDVDKASALASPAPLPATRPTTAPATADQPVVIRWIGPLRITPAPFPLYIAPGTSMVTLWGQPVVARHTDVALLQSTEARAGSMTYYTADGSVSLRPSAAVPKVLLTRFDDSTGQTPTMRVIAQNLDYVGRNQEAIFSGPGEAHVPTGSDQKNMDASWAQSAKIFFTATGHGQSAVSKAQLQGNVDVEDPQLSLQSQTLELRFAPPAVSALAHHAAADSDAAGTGNGDLRQVIASDSVNCRLTDTAGKKQTIDCQRLDVRMGHEEANTYPRQIFADGKVKAFDAEQELDAGHVELTMASAVATGSSNGTDASGAAVSLQAMDASDHVRLHGKSGQLAICDELQVDGDHGQVGRVELLAHNGLASLADQQSILSGPIIVMDNATQQDTVIGPGTLHLMPKDSSLAAPGGKSSANPIDVVWSDRAVVDGPTNAIDSYGKVVITQNAEDGSVYTARSPHLHITLEDKAVTREGQATEITVAASQPALVAGPGTDVFKNKTAKSVTLDQGADIRSTLTDAASGALLREMVLKAPTVIYTLGQSPGEEQTLLVPTPGQMLIRDYHTADNATNNAGGAQTAAAETHGTKGITAFAWKKSLTYTAADHRAVMLENVHVVHQESDTADPGRLVADRVIATFQPPAAKPKSGQANAADPSLAGPMQLKDLYAEGNVTVLHTNSKTNNDSKITGTSMEYDPGSHWLTIHGTPAQPVVFSDATGADLTQAMVAKWNTETWNIDFQALTARVKGK